MDESSAARSLPRSLELGVQEEDGLGSSNGGETGGPEAVGSGGGGGGGGVGGTGVVGDEVGMEGTGVVAVERVLLEWPGELPSAVHIMSYSISGCSFR